MSDDTELEKTILASDDYRRYLENIEKGPTAYGVPVLPECPKCGSTKRADQNFYSSIRAGVYSFVCKGCGYTDGAEKALLAAFVAREKRYKKETDSGRNAAVMAVVEATQTEVVLLAKAFDITFSPAEIMALHVAKHYSVAP